MGPFFLSVGLVKSLYGPRQGLQKIGLSVKDVVRQQTCCLLHHRLKNVPGNSSLPPFILPRPLFNWQCNFHRTTNPQLILAHALGSKTFKVPHYIKDDQPCRDAQSATSSEQHVNSERFSECESDKSPPHKSGKSDAPTGDQVVESYPALQVLFFSLQKEMTELKDSFARTLAEVENSRKRHMREMEESKKYAISGFAKSVIPVADDLALCLSHADATLSKLKSLSQQKDFGAPEYRDSDKEFSSACLDLASNTIDSLRLTYLNLIKKFAEHGVNEITPRVGEQFNPKYHEVLPSYTDTNGLPNHPSIGVANITSRSKNATGGYYLSQVVKPAYIMFGRVLRPALVVAVKGQLV